jgi:hypothetical protein
MYHCFRCPRLHVDLRHSCQGSRSCTQFRYLSFPTFVAVFCTPGMGCASSSDRAVTPAGAWPPTTLTHCPDCMAWPGIVLQRARCWGLEPLACGQCGGGGCCSLFWPLNFDDSAATPPPPPLHPTPTSHVLRPTRPTGPPAPPPVPPKSSTTPGEVAPSPPAATAATSPPAAAKPTPAPAPAPAPAVVVEPPPPAEKAAPSAPAAPSDDAHTRGAPRVRWVLCGSLVGS